MANSESTVALLRSKHRVFLNTSYIFKIKMDFTIERAQFVIAKKSLRELYVIIIKVNVIYRIQTKELENSTNMVFLNVISAGVSIVMF